MQFFSPLKKYFSDIMGNYSLDEIVASDIEKTIKEQQQCASVIRSHELLEHLAKRRLEALIEWTKQEAVKNRITPLPPISLGDITYPFETDKPQTEKKAT